MQPIINWAINQNRLTLTVVGYLPFKWPIEYVRHYRSLANLFAVAVIGPRALKSTSTAFQRFLKNPV
ncbi:hypothetical protein N574_01825 [Lactiplantibacillus plantarum 2165]|nr:hypothetical protein N574_01825 [Lactiplantibacillus plantarum 2165]